MFFGIRAINHEDYLSVSRPGRMRGTLTLSGPVEEPTVTSFSIQTLMTLIALPKVN